MKLLCIDDKNKPDEIPQEKWIKKDEEYTPTWVFMHRLQGNIQGIQVAEIDLDDSCKPYISFKLARFAVKESDLEELLALMRDCGQFSLADNDLLKDMLKEADLEVVEDGDFEQIKYK